MTYGRKVNADLVGTAGLEPTVEQAGDRAPVAARVTPDNLPMRDRRTAAGTHRHALARVRMAVDRLLDHTLRPVRSAPNEGEIGPLERSFAAMVGELSRQTVVGAVGLCHHHQPARVLV